MKTLVLCLLSLFFLSACTVSLPRLRGEVAYVALDGNLYTISANGGTPQRVTTDGLGYRHPVWSRNGERLAFLNQEATAILVASRRGQRFYEIYRSQIERPITLGWSPDGGHLAFTTTVPGNASLLHVVSLQTEAVKVLDAGQYLRWSWTAQGDLLVRTPERQSRLAVNGEVLDEEPLDTPLLPSPPPGDHLQVGVPSPDGQTIAYFVEEGDQVILSFTNPWTGLERRRYEIQPTPQTIDLLRRLETWQEGFRLWSPDGRHVAVAQSDAVGPAIWIYPASGQQPPRRLVEGIEASWSWR